LSPDTAPVKTAIETAIEAHLYSRRPKQYSDEPDPRDVISAARLSAIAVSAGAEVATVTLKTAGGSTITDYELDINELAKLRTLTWAIAASVETLYQTIRAIVTEANPGTAEDTLEQWYEMLGLRYDSTLRLATRQALARQGYVSIGGQSLADLNAAIQVAFPDVEMTLRLSRCESSAHQLSAWRWSASWK